MGRGCGLGGGKEGEEGVGRERGLEKGKRENKPKTHFLFLNSLSIIPRNKISTI